MNNRRFVFDLIFQQNIKLKRIGNQNSFGFKSVLVKLCYGIDTHKIQFIFSLSFNTNPRRFSTHND